MLATGEVPLVLPNERGELSVDPMTGLVVSSSDGSGGRPLPWLEVPGFREAVAQTAEGATDQMQSEAGQVGPTPELSIVPVEENAAPTQTETVAETAAEPATETAQTAEQSASAPVAEQPATSAAPAAPESKPAAAMPKDDDWDLPADLDGNNAFVPLEAGE